MANLSALAPLTTAATALSNLILVTPQQSIGYQPQSPSSLLGQTQQQPPALLFNYEGEQTVTLESDITDHYVEDNTAIQDQIALRPEVITTHGFIGELNNVTPKGLQTLKTIADKLTVINAYTPAISETALLAYNEALLAYQVANTAINAAVAAWSGGGLFESPPAQNVLNETSQFEFSSTQTQQSLYFQQFYAYWRNQVLFTVQTPWGVFSNCAIKSLRAIQDAETNTITDFEISFKVIRMASTQIIPAVGSNKQGRLSFQSGGIVDLGTTQGTPGPALASLVA